MTAYGSGNRPVFVPRAPSGNPEGFFRGAQDSPKLSNSPLRSTDIDSLDPVRSR